jgi:hypothetical protein
MFNLNDPYLTKQQKNGLLTAIANGKNLGKRDPAALDSSKSLKVFHSFWVLNMHDLRLLNAMNYAKLHSPFSFWDQKLAEYSPDYDVLILESDRVEKGEWDYVGNRWEAVGFQHALVICIHGRVEIGSEGEIFIIPAETLTQSERTLYPATAELEDQKAYVSNLGLIDIPLPDLDKFEDNRILKPLCDEFYENCYNSASKSAALAMRKSLLSAKAPKKRKKSKGFGGIK